LAELPRIHAVGSRDDRACRPTTGDRKPIRVLRPYGGRRGRS
jgi:hypothetical protein